MIAESLSWWAAVALGALAALAGNGAALDVAKTVVFFGIVSVGGWAWETVYCSIVEKRLVRRGFLFGPACPIYGVGAASVRLVLGGLDDPLLVFVIGAAMATAIEYTTGTVLWRRFHRRWWEYDEMPLNYRGIVCAPASAVFGGFSLATVFVLDPAFEALCATLSPHVVLSLAATIAAVLAADLCASTLWLDAQRRTQAMELVERVRALL